METHSEIIDELIQRVVEEVHPLGNRGTHHLFHEIRRFLSWFPLLQNSAFDCTACLLFGWPGQRLFHLRKQRSGNRCLQLNTRPKSLPELVGSPGL